ncbi:hypothetical protein VTL71DRAFT_1298 [Oculimacula yallundae]|uniref:Uncharacterized protein n=1 Tax=Oculimacula yallundae TaxID=86028 RepID=A0ABR4CCE7_9HELO
MFFAERFRGSLWRLRSLGAKVKLGVVIIWFVVLGIGGRRKRGPQRQGVIVVGTGWYGSSKMKLLFINTRAAFVPQAPTQAQAQAQGCCPSGQAQHRLVQGLAALQFPSVSQ